MGLRSGSVVRNKENRRMTVDLVDGDIVRCLWFTQNDQFDLDSFPIADLELIKEWHENVPTDIGDIVQLKSGGPRMRVELVNVQFLNCSWPDPTSAHTLHYRFQDSVVDLLFSQELDA